MKTKSIINIFALILVLFFLSLFIIYASSENNESKDWLIMILVTLSSIFIADFIKPYIGRKTTWDQLDSQGKVLCFIDLAILLLFTVWPMKKEMSLGVRLLSFLIGYLVVWVITFRFGSKAAKEKLLWPKL